MRLFRHPFGESVDVRFQGLGVLVVVQLFDGFLVLFIRRQEVHHFEIKKVLCSPVSARNRLNYAKRPRRPECQYIAVAYATPTRRSPESIDDDVRSSEPGRGTYITTKTVRVR